MGLVVGIDKCSISAMQNSRTRKRPERVQSRYESRDHPAVAANGIFCVEIQEATKVDKRPWGLVGETDGRSGPILVSNIVEGKGR
jgi:hypothetical protein